MKCCLTEFAKYYCLLTTSVKNNSGEIDLQLNMRKLAIIVIIFDLFVLEPSI